MATAVHTIPALLTLEEYLHTSYRPDCDFVDGHLEDRNGGDPKHSLLQIELGIWFYLHSEWNLRATSELRTRVSARRIRLPDVAVIPDDDALTTEYPRTTPPIIAIEILSPGDRMSRVVPRLQEFLGMGVENVWLLDPKDKIGWTLTTSGLNQAEDGFLRIPGSPVHLHLQTIFSALQKRDRSTK